MQSGNAHGCAGAWQAGFHYGQISYFFVRQASIFKRTIVQFNLLAALWRDNFLLAYDANVAFDQRIGRF